MSLLNDTYTNPLPVDISDPDVLKDGNTYYLYGTSSDTEGFIVYSSTDLVKWENRGFCFKKTPTSWGRKHFWSPSVIKRGDLYYMFYSSVGTVNKNKDSHRICLATSPSPLGPFVDVKAPFLESDSAAIDPHVFIDGDNAYLYYSIDKCENDVSHIYVSSLSNDLTQVNQDKTLCIVPSADWEGKIWNEAPFVIKDGDNYIMMYSANGFFDPNYSVGYATAKSPFGPWTKYAGNPILVKNDYVSGPGHNCLVESPDGTENFIIYHVHKHGKAGWQRVLAMDRIIISNHDGQVILSVEGPTYTAQPAPSAAKY